MANTGTQADQIRDLLVELLEAYDPTLNLAPGGAVYDRVVAPLYSSLGVDAFDTDLELFLLTRLRQEFPSLPAEQGDAIVDLVIRPLQLLLEGFKRELQIIRRGQSVRNSGQMRIQDAEDLAANFFVSRREGSRAGGTVRIFFANPTFVSLLASTELRTSSGLVFYPRVPQFFRPEVMAAQRSGQLYYLDVGVVAAEAGEEYNVEEGAISSVIGLASAVRATNRFAFNGGSYQETAEQLLQRTQTSLTERSLNTRRGVRARLFSEFPTIRNMEVVGFGDPEMQRDVITGSGGGDVITSGMSFVLGRYVLLLSMFENRGRDGARRIRAGSRIELNFWNFLYGTRPEEANQFFGVDEVVYESSEDLVGLPTIYLLKLDAVPDVDPPSVSLIPGLLPGVFAAAYDRAEIRISDIPGGITNPDANEQIIIQDGEVHIGGHYDVYVRPSASSSTSTQYAPQASEVAVYEGEELTLSGQIDATALRDYGALKNKVHSRLRIHYRPISGTLTETEVVNLFDGSSIEEDTGAYLLDLNTAERYLDLCCLTSDNDWSSGQIKGATSGAVVAISSVEQVIWEDVGVSRGMTLNVLTGPDAGVYKILDVRGVELVLDLDMTALSSDVRFRIIDETVVDAFSPQSPVYPFNADSATGLRTTIGSATVRVSEDLQQFGVATGHTFEILDGGNQGVYQITGFGANGGRSPILNSEMRSTDSSASFKIYSSSGGLTRPLVRVAPGGVALLDTSGQDTGYTVPPALPVGAAAYEGFSGARITYSGLNGFVLADAGTSWAPQSHTRLQVYDIDSATGELTNPSAVSPRSPDGTITQKDMKTISQYSGRPGTCYTDECLPSDDDYVAVMSLVEQGLGSGSFQTHLAIDLPTAATDFLQSLRDWMVELTSISGFDLGADFEALATLFAPFTLDPVDAANPIIAQYEVLIPKAIFDGCNNVFIAAPEFDWNKAFSGSTFEDAMDDYNNGELRNTPAALSNAKSGDVLTIDVGVNAGSYVIDKVYTYKIYHGGSIVSTDPSSSADDYLDARVAYTFSVVTVKGEFPVAPLEGLADFFSTRTASPLAFPSAPSFDVESKITTGPSAGKELGPWEVVQESFTWLFATLGSAGFDVPSEFVLDAGAVLKSLTKGFFGSYQVGRPTAEQIVRLFFTEPTSVTTFGPTSCANYSWNEEVTSPADVTGGDITLPVASSEGLEAALTFVGAASRTTLTGTVTAAIAALTSFTELATALQELLDPDEDLVRFTGAESSWGSTTGSITVSPIERGVGTTLTIAAEDREDGFRHFGFSDEEGGGVLQIPNSVAFPAAGFLSLSAEIDTTPFGVYYVEDDVVIVVGETLTITQTPGDFDITPLAVMRVDDPVFGGIKTVVLFDPASFAVLDPGDTPQVTLGSGTYDILSASSVLGINTTSGATYLYLGYSALEETLLTGMQASIVSAILAVAISDGILGAATSYESWEQELITGFSVAGDGLDLEISVESESDWMVFEFRTKLYDGTTLLSVNIDTSAALTGTLTLTEIFTLEVTQLDATTLTAALADSGASALEFEQAILANIANADDLASALNALNVAGDLGQFVSLSADGGDPQDELVLRVLAADQQDAVLEAATSLCFDAATPHTTLESVVWTADGTSEPGELQEGVLHPNVPTLFSVPAGTTELQFVASGTESPREVFPGASTTGQSTPMELPRDARLSAHYDDAGSFRAIASDPSLPAFVLSDVHVGEDFLRVFEQKILAEVVSSASEAVPEKADRVIAVATEAGSNIVSLLGTEDYSFLSPTSELDRDALREGDMLFTEEGDLASGYQIIDVAENQLTLDRPMPFTTGQVYRSGNEGMVEETDIFVDPTGPFISDDVGRYVTIYASNFPGMDGSYQILEVTNASTVVLDMDAFPVTETGLHWAVVRAPVDELGDSEIDGFNEMHGLRPVRLYSGIPSEWRIVGVHPSISRQSSYLTCSYSDAYFPSPYEVQRNLAAYGPIRGVNQPYAVIRRATKHLSSTEMKSQGLDRGLYYADVRAFSLGGDPVFNIPKDTSLTPLFGTYHSDGYRLEVEDPLFSYSSAERCKIRMSPRFLPADLTDIEENKISLERSRYQVTHEFSSLVAQVQALLLSRSDRTLCADPLARHFLPSYVYVDIRALGGDSESMAADIYAFIDSLEPEEVLDVSRLEKFLHSNDVSSYEHPVVIQIVTHDLYRRRVLTRSTDTIGSSLDEADFSGSHRTTFYIPGPPSFSDGSREGAERILISGRTNG
jgi:hypothetical protein